MPNREIYSTVAASQALVFASRTASVNSSTVDLQGFESAMFVCNIGAPGITLSATDKIGFQLQESDTTTDGDFTSVSAANTHNGESLVEFTANASASAAAILSYKGTKRYSRVRVIYSGTHGAGTIVGVNALRSHAAMAPVAQVN
jgi:hypothetical protein